MATISVVVRTVPVGASKVSGLLIAFLSATAKDLYSPCEFVAREGRFVLRFSRNSGVLLVRASSSRALYVSQRCSSQASTIEPSSKVNLYPFFCIISDSARTRCGLPSRPKIKSPGLISPIFTNPLGVGNTVLVYTALPPPAAPPNRASNE